MSGSGQDPSGTAGDPRSSWSPDPGGWPAPPPGSAPVPPPPPEGAWRDPRTGQWQSGSTTGYQDPGTSQWQATGTGAWGASPVDPSDPIDDPPPPRPGRAPLLAPLVAVLGLILIAGGSVFAAAKLDLVGGAAPTATPTAVIATQDPGQTYDPEATDAPEPAATPTPQPTAIVTPPPNEVASVPGSLLYVRDGNIYAFSGSSSTQLTSKGTDSSPTWSEDGKTIYFVQTNLVRGKTPPFADGPNGARADTMSHYATDIMSMNADGSGRKRLFTSMFKSGKGFWSTVAIQPDISPDGKTIVLASDGRYVPTSDTDSAAVVLSTMSANGKNLESMGIDYFNQGLYTHLGHNDPAWSPDGKSIAFTYSAKGGGKGAGVPRIGIVRAPFKKHTPELSPKAKGYANPSWSPDGRYLAAERIDQQSARHRGPRSPTAGKRSPASRTTARASRPTGHPTATRSRILRTSTGWISTRGS